MAATAGASAHCTSCGRGLAFEEWSHGQDRCPICRREGSARRTRTAASTLPTPADAGAAPGGYRAYQRMVDEVPDALIDELTRAIEDEARARRIAPKEDAADGLLRGLVDEIGMAGGAVQLKWTSWGFALGFGSNVALMKYAQMATGAPMSSVMMPMFGGGLLAGVTCAAITWGVSRLRER